MALTFDQKAHYQNLKASCMATAAGLISLEPENPDDLEDFELALVSCAKRLYNEITGQDWSGPDVEGA